MATFVRRAWALPLWAHAAALAVGLLALLPVMSPTSSFTSDEGAYALQVRALRDGSWTYDYKAAPLDPTSASFPIIKSDGGPGGFYPSVKHPAFPLVLLGTTRLFGEALGLHLPGLLGVVGAAIAGWLLAKELEPRLARPAFWVTAASPVVVGGVVVWAHAPSAAAAGFALVGASRMARRGLRAGPVGLTVAAVVAGVLLRSEGVLFAGALAAGLVVVSLKHGADPEHGGPEHGDPEHGDPETGGPADDGPEHDGPDHDGPERGGPEHGVGPEHRYLEHGGPKRRLWARAVGAGALIVLPAALTVLAERAWIDAIVGDSLPGQAIRGDGSGSFLGGRISGAWHELFQAHFLDSSAGPPVLLAAALAVGLGYVALRRWDRRSRLLLAVGVGGAGTLLALRFAAHPHDAVTGLVAAWPLALLGVLLFRWRESGPVAALLGLTVALFAAAILATQYPEGGGLEWGGRFLFPILVPLAVLATAGLIGALDDIPEPDRPYATTLVTALTAVTAVFALATAGSLRAREDRIIAALERHPATVTVTTRPAYPRIAWRADDRLSWMLTDDAGLPALVERLEAQDVDRIAVVVPRDTPIPRSAVRGQEVDEPALRDDGMKLVVIRAE